MLFFGYIVSDIKYKDLEEDIVKVVNNINECTQEDVPKLIVGLDNAKKYAFANNWEFDILEHVYPNGDMWTFKKTEKREFYEEDIETFKKRIVKYQGKEVIFHPINIYKLKYSKLKRLYDICFNNGLNKEKNYIIIGKKNIYIAIDGKNIIGISFTHLEYIGISRDKIINKLKQSEHNKLYFTTSKKMWKLKEWFTGREYVIASVFEKNTKKDI